MNGPIEPLAHQHDDECKCKERQSINMAQPQITGEKITHVRAKMLARQSAVQYRGPRVGRWIDCMRVTLWRDISLRSTSRYGFLRGRIDRKRRRDLTFAVWRHFGKTS